MRLLWVSNAPWTPTGYGVQTKLFAPRLAALGHEVAIAATHGLEGGILTWRGMRVYPRGRSLHSQDVIAAHAVHFGADAVLTLMDAWACEPRLYAGIDCWVPWFPVEQDPLLEPVRERVEQAEMAIAPTTWGQDVAQRAGIPAAYVPFGVDQSVFVPGSQREARERLGLPADRWTVGIVADNKDDWDRKAFVAQIAAFAAFRHAHPDALLYLHTNDGRDGRGLDLVAICRQHGLGEDAVQFSDQYAQLLGHPERAMVDVYNALDLLSAASSWEGFCVPLIEAQSCGVPVVTCAWSAMPELLRWDGLFVDDSEPRWHGQRGCLRYPRVDAIRVVWEHIYRRSPCREAIRAGVAQYDADLITERHWRPALADVERRISARRSPSPPEERVLTGSAA